MVHYEKLNDERECQHELRNVSTSTSEELVIQTAVMDQPDNKVTLPGVSVEATEMTVVPTYPPPLYNQHVIVALDYRRASVMSVEHFAELRQYRIIAVILSTLSLLVGTLCCAIPAIILAAQPATTATRSMYAWSMRLSVLGLLVGLPIVLYFIRAHFFSHHHVKCHNDIYGYVICDS